MRIIWTTKEKWDKSAAKAHHKRSVVGADMIVVDGVIVKNRNGEPGVDIGKALYIWAEREESDESIGEGAEGRVSDCQAVPE